LLANKTVDTRQLPVETATDLLAVSHAIEVGAAANLSSEYRFEVTPIEGEIHQSDYFHQQDVFEIRLLNSNEQ